MDKQYKVLVVYHYVAHYRKSVFTKLCDSSNSVEYYIAADDKANNSSLKVLSGSELFDSRSLGKRWYHLKNRWFFNHFLWQKGLLSLVWEEDFDSVIFLGNMYFFSTWVALVLCKVRKIKILMWTHGVRSKESGIKKILRNSFYRMADGIMLYGHRAKSLLVEEGFYAKNLSVIYNSLDFDDQLSIRDSVEEWEVTDLKYKLKLRGCDVIIATGRLSRDKRFDLLIDALKKISELNELVKLIIVGDGPEREKLESMVARYSLGDRVIFYGESYDEVELCKLFLLSNVSVVPGDIGLSAIHALTYGVPVITHDNFDRHKPEFEAITNGVNGGFYEYGSLDSLTQLITEWLLSKNKDLIKQECLDVIRKHYNAENQVKLINESVYRVLEK